MNRLCMGVTTSTHTNKSTKTKAKIKTRTAKKTAKPRPKRPNAATVRAAARAYQNHLDREVYKAYCAGFSRQMQHSKKTAAVLMLDADTATTAEIVAFAMGLEHGGRGQLLCNLDDVVTAVAAYTAPSQSTKERQ